MGLKRLSRNKKYKIELVRIIRKTDEFNSGYEPPTRDWRATDAFVAAGSLILLGLCVLAFVLGLISILNG